MPRNDRIQCYPDPRALALLGATEQGEVAPTINQAIEIFADLIARATIDNESAFSRAEWALMADACNGVMMYGSQMIAPRTSIVANVCDGDRLQGLGAKHLRARDPAAKVSDLVQRVQALDDLHCWAILWSIGWFWRRCEMIDAERDKWWTLAFRREAGSASKSAV